MKMNKLFLMFSIFSLGTQMPIKAAGLGYKPAALMAAASTGAAVLANGVIAIADSIKKDKVIELSAKVVELSKENDFLTTENDRLQRLSHSLNDCLTYARNQVKNQDQFGFQLVALAGIGIGLLIIATLLKQPQEVTTTDNDVSDKAEVNTIKA